MQHARRQVLDDVLALVTGLPTTGAGVHEELTKPLALGALPAVVVEPGEEDVEPLLGAPANLRDPHRQRRTLRVRVTVVARTVADRDAACLEVEAALAPRAALRSVEFSSTQDGSTTVHAVEHEYEVEYAVLSTDPSTLLPS